MKEKFSDLIYAARNLCEALKDRAELLDKDEELKDFFDELDSCLDKFADEEEDDLFD